VATSSASTNAWLALLRIFTGIFWLYHGYGKLTNPEWSVPNGMMVQIVQNMIKDTSGPYHDFVVNVVLTHVQVFANLVAWGELLVGVSLVLGLLTVAGGIGGAFLALQYFMAKSSFMTLAGWTAFDMFTAVVSLVCALAPGARTFSLDALLFKGRRR
jgi:thiosulfate dehydrogenase (quinone) large subunit